VVASTAKADAMALAAILFVLLSAFWNAVPGEKTGPAQLRVGSFKPQIPEDASVYSVKTLFTNNT
jgi:hypothetical protein